MFNKKDWVKRNKPKMKSYRDKYKKNNPEEYKKSQKKYYEKTKEKQKEKVLKWVRENRDKARLIQNRNYHKNLKHCKKGVYNNLIRTKTRQKYGKALVCSICESINKVEHHHNTEPYEVDEFIDLCYECHKNLKEDELK